ncbi:MAG: ImmA/IrrE family metallo-endopeptidase [Bdellovibrionota bacterium]
MIAIFPELSSCAKSGKIDQLAILARSYFGGELAKKPAIDLHAILKSSGIEVKAMPLETYGAIAVNDEKGSFRILVVYKEGLSYEETQFNLAHMLGHVLIDIQPAISESSIGKIGLREEESPLECYVKSISPTLAVDAQAKQEILANQFAAALLMPEGMVRRAAEKIKDCSKLATFFSVTEAAMEKRLIDLEIVVGEPSSFLDGERKIKGKVMDPVLPTDKPLNLSQLKSPNSISNNTGGGVNSNQFVRGYSDSEKLISEGDEQPKAVDSRDQKTEIGKNLNLSERAREIKGRQKDPSASAAMPDSQSSLGLKRLRELAKKLDKSVEM